MWNRLSEIEFFNNTLSVWLLAFLTVVFILLLAKFIKGYFQRRLENYPSEKAVAVAHLLIQMVTQTRGYFILILALYAGSLLVQLPAPTRDLLRILTITVFLVQAGFWLTHLINFWINRRINQELKQDNTNATTLNGLGLIARTVLWIILVLLILENVTGIEITTLVASLGITGVAVALAVQNILSDLFASLSITLDRPFVIGDSIMVGEFIGQVEHIGLKSTRIRSLTGEQLIFSNSDLLNSRIRNYKRMELRRVVLRLGVAYHTPARLLEQIPQVLKEIISEREQAGFDRAHFKEFGDSALVIEVVYFIKSPDYLLYMDIQQEINLAILRRFEEMGVEFAFPTQTIYLASASGQELARPA